MSGGLRRVALQVLEAGPERPAQGCANNGGDAARTEAAREPNGPFARQFSQHPTQESAEKFLSDAVRTLLAQDDLGAPALGKVK